MDEVKDVQVTEQVTVQVKEELLETIGLEENVLQLSKDQDKLAKLWESYSKFIGEVKHPQQTATNPFLKNKYAPLNEVLNEVNPVLAKHGLAVVQMPYLLDNGLVSITSVMTHKDGAYIVFPPLKLKPQKQDSQGIGGAITYARRYALSAICGVASEADEDGNDDGTDKKKSPPKSTPVPEIKKLQNKITTLAKTMTTGGRRDEALKLIGHEGKVGQIKTEKEAKEVIVKLEEALKGEK